MPKPFFIEEPPKEKLEEFLKELKEYKGLEPRLTFNFPLNERRRKALEMLKTGKIEEENVLDLLNSDDFIERRVGISFLKNLPEISKENYEKFLKVLDDLVNKEKIFSLEILKNKLKFIAQNEPDKAISILKEAIRGRDKRVKEAAIFALGYVGKKSLPIFDELSKNKDWLIREKIIFPLITLAKNFDLDNQVFKILKNLSKDNESYVRKEVALYFPILKVDPSLKEEFYSIFKELSQDKLTVVRKAVAESFKFVEKIDEEEIKQLKEILGNLVKDKKWEVRRKIAESLASLPEEIALGYLKELSEDKEPFVKCAVIQSLINFKEKAKPILEKLAQDEIDIVKELASFALEITQEKAKEWLLFSRKPLFATPYTKELSERILKIQEIAKQLKKEFKDDFIGLIILGSTVKGYFKKESDLDWGIIAKNKKVVERFKELGRPLNLCLGIEKKIKITEENELKGDFDILFSGIFIGDFDKLLEIQKKFLDSIDEKKWDDLREKNVFREINLIKSKVRFGLSEKDFEKLQKATLILKIPPTYQETLKILQNKLKYK